MKHLIILFVVGLFLSGCSTYSAARYSISADNVVALRSIPEKSLSVGEFKGTTSDQTEIMCRGVGPIKTPDGETFAQYVRRAFISELKIAEKYSITAPVTITGNLDSIDFSSTSGRWNMALTIKSSNGKSMTANEGFDYTSSFYGETACNQTAQALMPAVQDLVGKVVRSQEFAALAKP